MTQQEVFERIRRVLEKDFRIPPVRVTRESTFRGTLGLDSLDAVDLIYLVCVEFELKPTVEAFTELETVGKVVDYICQVKA
jgi:acyl carrier protein